MRLRVLSLNVWALPFPIGRHVRERLSLVLRDLPALDCDLFLVQEVWTEAARDQLLDGGLALGYRHSWTRPGPARSSSGLLVLSRWPIRSAHFRRFGLGGLPQRLTQLDYYSGKGVVRLDIEVEGVSLAVFDTHMQARYAPAQAVDEHRGHRTAQVIEFAEEIRRVSGPLIAAGDFNMRDTAPEYMVLEGLTGLVDAAAALGAREPTSTLENPYRRDRNAMHASRIDYVFSRSGRDRGARPVAARRVFDDPLEVAGEPGAYSDHAGVMAEIEIAGPGAPLPAPAPPAVDLARTLLEVGREQTEARRVSERAFAGASLAVGFGALWTSGRSRLSRRSFLRAGLFGSTAMGAGSGIGLLALAEGCVPEELAGYDAAESLLGSLR